MSAAINGVVSHEVARLIGRAVAEKGLVVWFDPDRAYVDLLDGLLGALPPGTEIVRYLDSFFALRRDLDQRLGGEAPPRLLVYVPLDRAATHDALVEAQALGVSVYPGASPWQWNTRLAVVAARALRDVLGAETADALAKQAEAGSLGLADLDRLAEHGAGVATGSLSLIFGTTNPGEIALALLTDPARDRQIVARGAIADLERLFASTFELPVAQGAGAASADTAEAVAALRTRLARHILLTDLMEPLLYRAEQEQAVSVSDADLPAGAAPLAALGRATRPNARVTCCELARNWRQRRDHRESYVSLATEAETALPLAAPIAALDPAALEQIETFPAVEEALQQHLEAQLLRAGASPPSSLGAAPADGDGPLHALVGLARQRQSSFWSEALPDVQARWALIATAGDVLVEAARVEAGLKRAGAPAAGAVAAAIVSAYAEGSDNRPWCLLDTAHRHLERRVQAFDFDVTRPSNQAAETAPAAGGRHAGLERLIFLARRRYMEVGGDLAERFVRAYQGGRFQVAGFRRQRDVFERWVRPALAEGKVAYVLGDALRFEMARELAVGLTSVEDGLVGSGPRAEASRVEVRIEPVVGTMPSITEIGMAALLPGAEQGPKLVALGPSKLGLQIDGVTLGDRRSRIDFLKRQVARRMGLDGRPLVVADARLEDFLPSKKATRDRVSAADLVLVTSQEIDELCESDNVPLARKTMDGVLNDMRRTFRALMDLGVKTIVVSADHGFIFGDDLDSDMKIEAPGGATADLHRRVWVGRGGKADAAYVRATAIDLDLAGPKPGPEGIEIGASSGVPSSAGRGAQTQDTEPPLEVAAPWGFACFKVQGGANAYFHGGLSPQELIVPVVTIVDRRPAASAGGRSGSGDIAWTLRPGSRKISSRFVSVEVSGQLTGLFETVPPRVRVEVFDRSGALSTPVSASYGFDEATGDVQLDLAGPGERVIAPNTIAVMLTETAAAGSVSIRLVEASTGRVLERVGPIPVIATL